MNKPASTPAAPPSKVTLILSEIEKPIKTDLNVATDGAGHGKQMLDFARHGETLTPRPVAGTAG